MCEICCTWSINFAISFNPRSRSHLTITKMEYHSEGTISNGVGMNCPGNSNHPVLVMRRSLRSLEIVLIRSHGSDSSRTSRHKKTKHPNPSQTSLLLLHLVKSLPLRHSNLLRHRSLQSRNSPWRRKDLN